MRVQSSWFVLCLCLGGALGGCDDGTPQGRDGGVDAGLDAGGGAARDAGEDAGVDAGVCVPALCSGLSYACGNCADDDGDGLIDSQDPDCTGPCDNDEGSLELKLPGLSVNCSLDCAFDSDPGSGNDGCSHNLRCDPLQPGANACVYDGGTAQCSVSQTQSCLSTCEPLTPNGCDCFGCCTVPLSDGGTRDVFIFSEQFSGGTCSTANAGDPACRSCTKNAQCEATCGTCQLCLGKSTLPAQCFDGGSVDAIAQCPSGAQPCGLPGQAACPNNGYCLTGCCVQVP